jgi:hypothetical protein
VDDGIKMTLSIQWLGQVKLQKGRKKINTTFYI